MHWMIERRDSRAGGLLKAADPVKGDGLGPGVEDALDELGSAIVVHRRPAPTAAARRRWSTTPRGLAAIGAALLVLAGGAAAATQLLGAGELREAAPSFCRNALRLSDGIPYPQGYSGWRSWVLVSEGVLRVTTHGPCDSKNQGGLAVLGRHQLQGFFAQSAFCAWIYDWRAAERSGDHVAVRQAAKVISDAPRWPAVRAVDPDPTASAVHETPFHETQYYRHHPHLPHPMFVRGQHSLFGWLLPFRDAVLDGNVTRVDWLIAGHYGLAGCSFWKPLPGSHGGTALPRKFRRTAIKNMSKP